MDQPDFEIKDFIGVFPDAVNPNFCDYLCEYLDNATELQGGRNYTHVKDKQICLDAFSPGESKNLMEFVNGCLYYYINELTYLTNFNYVSAVVLLQKTQPTEGYHMFHGENINWNLHTRTMAWMAYLNDVEEGGETEFLYQNRREEAIAGDVLMFPAGFTHTHRGNPPIGNSKYLVTSWGVIQDDD